VTARTYQRLKDSYWFERRGPIPVKGQGDIVTYFLVGRAKTERLTERQEST
jgi:adenylate cyclase